MDPDARKKTTRAEGRYPFAEIEKKWQQKWLDTGLFRADDDSPRPGFYLLVMYPYPSGVLHMGHVINYTLGDAMVRYKTMRGFNVLSPMGWDSFGLPAENAAIKLGIHPAESTRKSIDAMRRQMKKAGWGYDWDREIATSHPGYYKWTQWLFLKFYERGEAVRKTAAVNWCPSCSTVLANEQVIDGQCERCSSPVGQRDLEQWFFSMSAHAERLLDNLEKLKGKWPDRVLRMQEDWIGRSEGARVDFTIAETGEKLPIFTTRPDTLWGVTFMSLAPEHPLIKKLVEGKPNEKEVMAKVREMRRVGTSQRERVDLEKAGVFTGCHVINPVNGEKVQLWVANFALMSYGTGAVMAVPAHDQRDFEFARKYGLPIKVVIQPEGKELRAEEMKEAYLEEGIQVESGPFTGMKNTEAAGKIIKYLEEKGVGGGEINYRLRDWLLSRQRYWGAPIPIIYCDRCAAVPVPEKDLPVLLPDDVDFKPSEESPLARSEEFVNAACPKCGGPGRRETDTMDTFVDSSWYFLRYLSPRNEEAAFEDEKVKKWMPVDLYIGGIEHATMHLIYFRYFTQVLHDLGLVDFDEPAERLFCQGMVCKEAHHCPKCKWLWEYEVKDGKCLKCGSAVRSEVYKISKTKLNIVDPDSIIKGQGADTLRLAILSDAPPDRDQLWDNQAAAGSHRFLNRLWTFVTAAAEVLSDDDKAAVNADDLTPAGRDLHRRTHATIKKVTEACERTFHFNTAIAEIMTLFNEMRSLGEIQKMQVEQRRAVFEAIRSMLLLLAPITPHICEELWQKLGGKESIFSQPWPEYDEEAIKAEVMQIALQVNGKVRAVISIRADISKEELEKTALANPRIKAHTEGKKIKRVIVVPGKLVNVVAK